MRPLSTGTFFSLISSSAVHFAGVILPDTIHRVASDKLVEGLEAYVRGGGKLMVVFDAATLNTTTKTYASQRARLSNLIGVDYALYDQFKGAMIRHVPVFGSQQALSSLRIPPGKFYSTAKAGAGKVVVRASTVPAEDLALFAYGYGMMRYPHFVTRGTYPGQVLLYTDEHDVVAGVRQYGEGQVLFVDLPLGYLKTRTDGVLLHGFLHYFGVDLVRLPYLSGAPNGLGGLVMNWHIDSNAALPALRQFGANKIFEQGPYSVHVTAGPDTREPNDGLGFNVPGNTEAQEWLRFFAARNDRVGSHGGWIHDYFGANVSETNREQFEPYLRLNKEAIEAITQQPVTEYSAPVGTHPRWVTQWLDEHNIVGYYFTGDTGLGPTKPYQNDQRSSQRAWAFPVLNMGKYAAFEEMAANGVSEQEVAEWLQAVTQFVANDHCIRLVYFHPPGLVQFIHAVEAWLEYTRALSSRKYFTWYTMTEAAWFLNEREKVNWRITRQEEGEMLISASHPLSLQRQSWRIAAEHYSEPGLLQGNADVLRDGNDWLVRAKEGKKLMFKVYSLPQKSS
jgi:hypothetical protein